MLGTKPTRKVVLLLLLWVLLIWRANTIDRAPATMEEDGYWCMGVSGCVMDGKCLFWI